MAWIDLGETRVEVVRKDIKNLHLSVLPPQGKVRIAAPQQMNLETIRVFAIGKLAWIRSQQRKLQEQEREAPRDFLDRESHYVWGRRYLLKRVEKEASPRVELKHKSLVLYARSDARRERSGEILDAWYREQLRSALPALIAQWEPVLRVQVGKIFVQRMKTQWGSCNPVTRSIRLNTDLAKKPPECLEYILVHEMTHLLEPTHNANFTALMDLFMPDWPHRRRQLNQLPVRHEDWAY